ncbi:MAG: bifunctional biotin--[acetyl-CoA-carboxylase] ligase/biotin operon repressor BirA [Xanthomonadaceae bacterium]|jgi:BirA family biotin operon repressor/biotin-[acetyl-CoA-carboxylase] ligase|nr:bifunctional biotin--[acetyl-CoA-carboxylase] ligase/biotin operon repressor BirA [Xanthomonadaceae bacterium]
MDDRWLLLRLAAGPVSGDELAREAGVTRAAVWKRIQGLRMQGIRIEGRTGGGYQLQQSLELLDADAIRAGLSRAAQAMLATLNVVWSVDSTNSELLRHSPPDAGAEVLLAERQTRGRGRRGREWESPLAAHLYLSVLQHFSGGLARLGGLSLVAGIAAAEALRAAGFAGVGLKWPNDLVETGRKLAGLLVEGAGEYAGAAHAVIGLGINFRMPPPFADRIQQAWVDLSTLQPGSPLSRNAIAGQVLSHLLPALELFDREGLRPFLPRYERLDSLSKRQVRVLTGNAEISGIALGIAPDGALRLATSKGEQLFHAGEVSVRTR